MTPGVEPAAARAGPPARAASRPPAGTWAPAGRRPPAARPARAGRRERRGTGGATGTGGTPATGGAGGRAGATGTGGTLATGGTGGKAGATGTGGKAGATGTGGTPATGGTSGAGGAASPAICKFASGLNVAWVNFANDIPSPNLATFNTIFPNSASVGGRVIRWWFHTNGTVTPGYDANGMAKPLTSGAQRRRRAANAAHTAGVALNISLWSFDMLQGGENIPTATLTNNQKLLTVDANRQAYIDNVLTPLVNALKGNPGVYSYETFNEPEGMTTEHGWTQAQQRRGRETMIQKTVNWFAAAIHTADPRRA